MSSLLAALFAAALVGDDAEVARLLLERDERLRLLELERRALLTAYCAGHPVPGDWRAWN